jgi:hypothetical protein
VKITLPTRLSTALGLAITSLIALAQETHWSHELKQTIVIAGGLVLAWLVHPGEAGIPAPTWVEGVPGANATPDPPEKAAI